MNAFLQILHKQCAKTNELYNVLNVQNSQQYGLDITDKTYNYELKNHELTYCDKLIIITFNILLLTPFYNTKTKFNFLSSIRDNKFYDDSTKDMIYTVFYQVQNKYHKLNRLVYRYKYSKSSIVINTDISLSKINESNKNVITILQNNQKYLFTLYDLKKIIENSLSNSPYHFSHPLPIKNPYNNLPFEKSTLYNIYFFMKKSDFVIPTLFHHYFLSNFNLTKFQEENEIIIQQIHLKQYLRNSSLKELKSEILYMLKQNKYSKKIKIDTEFPKEKLIEIFKPYLELFYTQLYSIDLSARTLAKKRLYNNLKEFYIFNPAFGVKSQQSNKNKTINDKCIKFNKINYNKNYDISHIMLYDNDEDSDVESESESESDIDDITIVETNRVPNNIFAM
jgi:hypothetical protein